MNKLLIGSLTCLMIQFSLKAQQITIEPDSTYKPTLAMVDSLKELHPVVFSNKGCGRCTTAKNFLTEKGIPFVMIDLGIPENRSLMYSVAQRAAGSSLRGIHYPVILFKNDTQYGQSDLTIFLNNLAEAAKPDNTIPR